MFSDLLTPGDAAVMVDNDGLVLAGAYWTPSGRNVAEEMSAALSGVSDEAMRATRHLAIGSWRTIVFEAELATVTLTRVTAGGESALLLVAASPTTPLGALMRTQSRCLKRAVEWMEAQS